MESSASRARSLDPSCVAYADLHVTSNFTFLTGASHPDELVQRAVQFGFANDSLAGMVRSRTVTGEPASTTVFDDGHAHNRSSAGNNRIRAQYCRNTFA